MLLLFFGSTNYIESATDSESLADTSTASLGLSRSQTDPETLSDTAVISQGFVRDFSEDLDLSDTSSLSISVNITESIPMEGELSEIDFNGNRTALELVQLTDSRSYNQGKTYSESLGLEDEVSVAYVLAAFEDDEMVASSDLSIDRSIVINEDGEAATVARFGLSPGFGTFTFGKGQSFVSDTYEAIREYFFTENIGVSDSHKTVKVVPTLRIFVDTAELRWEVG